MSPTIFSVTADGRTLALVEAKTEFGGWAGSLEDLHRGNLPLVKRLVTGVTRQPGLRISPDGGRVLLNRGGRWSIAPFTGGKETPLEAGIEDARWNDAATLPVKNKGSRGDQLSVMEASTSARHALFDLPADAAATAFVSLSDGRWASIR